MTLSTTLLEPVPVAARYLTFSLTPGADVQDVREALDGTFPSGSVVGLGPALLALLSAGVPGLRPFPVHTGPGVHVPSTPGALWVWLRGDDRGELVHQARRLVDRLALAFEPIESLDAFRYRSGHDLSGYEDGTENPTGDDALNAAMVQGQGPGLDGSAFASVMTWEHDLDALDAMSQKQRDQMIGRRQSDNEELDDAPPSAHVKRTAQESFEPEAFVLRRSMPWSDAASAGLVFVAFGRSLDAFEAQLRRMVGAEDGIVDALFRFTRPLTGAHYWCPPQAGGRLDLRGLGLKG